MVMGRIGKDFVSANSITVVTQQLTTVFIQGVSFRQYHNWPHLRRRKKKKAQEQAYTFLMLGIIIGAMSGAIILALSNTVVNFYNITDETKTIAIELMRSIAIIVVFQSMNSILTKGVLRGGGDTKFLMLADILFLWILSIPLGYLAGLVWNWSAYWIYFCLKSDQIVKAIWCIFRLRSGKWIKAINKQEL